MNKGTPADPLALREQIAAAIPFMETCGDARRVMELVDQLAALAVNARPRQCWLNGGDCLPSGRCERPRFCAQNDTVTVHPTESAGKSPEAAGAKRANEIIASLVDKGYAQESGRGWNERVRAAREYLAETQRSSNANGSDEQTSPSVQPLAPEPLTEERARELFNDWYEQQPMPQLLARVDPQQAAHNAFEFGRALTPPSIAQRGAALTDAYYLPGTDIKIQRVQQKDGSEKWAVRLGSGDCLNKSGEWEWEPQPSSRDEGFLARCRFDSAHEAIDAALALSPERPEPPADSTTGEKP